MITISLATLAKVTDGELIVAERQTALSLDDLAINDLVTDSRAIVENPNKSTAFLALKGPSFDGHRFAKQVIKQGCKLLIVDHQLSEVTDTAQLVVSDTRIALGPNCGFC